MNTKPLYFALVLSALLLATHLYALSHYLYWHYRWFDIPMHILGGIAIGSFLLAFFSFRRFILYFSLMLAIVVLWEVFENVTHISTGQPDYWLDTFKDMIDGLLGSAFTYFIVKDSSWRSN